MTTDGTQARQHRATERARACFLRACGLDVAVRKPGNVSRASPGHGMHAEMFIVSAQAAAAPLFQPGAPVGERIEAAVAASWAVAGCNTNLGILLLCAPIAAAVQRHPEATTADALRRAIGEVLADLDLADAQAAYRAIARAQPGGLGTAPSQDVRDPPSVDLRAAMALAADATALRASTATASPICSMPAGPRPGFSLMSTPTAPVPDANTVAAVQRLYLSLLSRFADSHIVRNHGDAVAHIVMSAAQAWQLRARRDGEVDADPDFAAWDASLKADRINPGTTADLTVATLLIAGLCGPL